MKIVVRDQDRKALRDMAVVIGKNIDHGLNWVGAKGGGLVLENLMGVPKPNSRVLLHLNFY